MICYKHSRRIAAKNGAINGEGIPDPKRSDTREKIAFEKKNNDKKMNNNSNRGK